MAILKSNLENTFQNEKRYPRMNKKQIALSLYEQYKFSDDFLFFVRFLAYCYENEISPEKIIKKYLQKRGE